MNKGFTLAEVLITLGIIGVVAAMTVPNLIQSYKEKEYSAKLKKFYSVMENAGRLVEEEYGPIDSWDLTNSFVESGSETEEEIADKEKSKTIFWTRYSKFIHLTEQKGSNIENIYGMDKKSKLSTAGQLKRFWTFNDGTTVRSTWLQASSTNCSNNNSCGDLSIDLNGSNGPNAVGRDIFFFEITKNGIKPMGYKGTQVRPFEQWCVRGKTGAYNGYGCTAWVIYNENMDYLHCDGLDWDKKTRCK